MAEESKIELAYRLAKAEAATGGKSVSDKDFSNAQARVKNMSAEQIRRLISDLESAGAAGKAAQPTNTGAVGKLQRLQQGLGMQQGGKMKKGYRAIGEVKRKEKAETIKARIERLAQQLAELETAGGERKMQEQDINYAKARLESAERSPEAKQRLDEYMKSRRSPHKGMRRQYLQYGGMADMSAAPMMKQPQRKKRKASGFRTKYSKGGGVRSSKYKL